MSERQQALQAAYEQLLALDRQPDGKKARKKHHVLSAEVMTRFVQENAANLLERPSFANNTAVRYSEPALQRLRALVVKYDQVIEGIIDSTWPSLRELYMAFEQCRLYVPFETLLADMRAIVSRGIESVKQRPRERLVVCLALPDSRVDKSSVWFNSYVWANTALTEHVDFVVPSSAAAVRLLDTLGPEWKALILYVDDMAYSGSQISEFYMSDRMFLGPENDRFELYPMVAYRTDQVDCNFARYTDGAKFPLTGPCTVVPTLEHWARFYKNGDQPFPVFNVLYYATKGMIDAVSASSAKDKFLVEFYQLFTNALINPVVVFEHKLADYASIAIDLFQQKLVDPDEQPAPAPVDRQLVVIGDGRLPMTAMGSTAFYKTLQWNYKGGLLKSTKAMAHLYALHLGIRDTDDADVVENIIARTDDADLDALAQTNKRLRMLVDKRKRGVTLEVTSAMVDANRPALEAWADANKNNYWSTNPFDYPELRRRMRELLASLAHMDAPKKLVIGLHRDPLVVMPAIPLEVTRHVETVKAYWLDGNDDGEVGDIQTDIPYVLFNSRIYPNLHALKARAFVHPLALGAMQELRVLECRYQDVFVSFDQAAHLHTLRLGFLGDRIDRLPGQVKNLWIKTLHTRPVRLSLNILRRPFTFGRTDDGKTLAVETLVFADTVFDIVDRPEPKERFVHVKRLGLFRCTFHNHTAFKVFRRFFPADIDLVVRDIVYREREKAVESFNALV